MNLLLPVVLCRIDCNIWISYFVAKFHHTFASIFARCSLIPFPVLCSSQTFIEMICYSIVFFFFAVNFSLFFSLAFRFVSYNIVFLAFTYGIPMVVMLICYSVMGRELWGSQSIGENTERQTESVKSKKKVSMEHLLSQYGTHPYSLFFCLFICYCWMSC